MALTSRADVVARIGALFPLRDEWVDRVVPGAVEPLRTSSYSPAYRWMYAYEKQLRTRIERAHGRPLSASERRALFGPDGTFSEGLSNAFVHGHGRQPNLVIEVWAAVGRAGLALSICDQGHGFDVVGAVDGLEHGRGYYHLAGNGLRALVLSASVAACYWDAGRRLTLVLLLGG